LADELNAVFVLLDTLVGFTTSVFSANHIGHELEIGRLTRGYLRFYHAMYQLMMFGMNLALVANNIGLIWVAVELAKGTQRIAEIEGLTESHPGLGWSLVASVAAIVGLPPFGVFMSEFPSASSIFACAPPLALILVFGLLVGCGALLPRVTGLAFGAPEGRTGPARDSTPPVFAHLARVLSAGLHLRRASSHGSRTWRGCWARAGHDDRRRRPSPPLAAPHGGYARLRTRRGAAGGRSGDPARLVGEPDRADMAILDGGCCVARHRGAQPRLSGWPLPLGRPRACPGDPP
jgi:NADH:ubiquinone oxidoreductase subunit 4 (subunit M)